MRRVTLGALAAVLFSTPALAQMADVDTDGDGMASHEEIVVMFPSLTVKIPISGAALPPNTMSLLAAEPKVYVPGSVQYKPI